MHFVQLHPFYNHTLPDVFLLPVIVSHDSKQCLKLCPANFFLFQKEARAGVEHIGLGSDYDGIGRVPVGLEDCSKLGAIYDALLHRNWKESDARGVMGENFLRYWARVQAAGESAAKG